MGSGHSEQDGGLGLTIDSVRRFRPIPISRSVFVSKRLDLVLATVETAVHEADRSAPIDLFRFPAASADRFIDESGRITVSREGAKWVQVGNVEAWT